MKSLLKSLLLAIVIASSISMAMAGKDINNKSDIDGLIAALQPVKDQIAACGKEMQKNGIHPTKDSDSFRRAQLDRKVVIAYLASEAFKNQDLRDMFSQIGSLDLKSAVAKLGSMDLSKNNDRFQVKEFTNAIMDTFSKVRDQQKKLASETPPPPTESLTLDTKGISIADLKTYTKALNIPADKVDIKNSYTNSEERKRAQDFVNWIAPLASKAHELTAFTITQGPTQKDRENLMKMITQKDFGGVMKFFSAPPTPEKGINAKK